MAKTICLDFDGVIHSYTSRWIGADVIPDPPVPGAFNFIREALNHGYKVAVFSSRSHQEGGIEAMIDWFCDHGGGDIDVDFPEAKPPAILYIDDRGFHFQGEFPPFEYVENFKPWNKQ